MYLPLTAHTVHRLSSYGKGEKPIAETKLIDYIMIAAKINGVNADHVVADANQQKPNTILECLPDIETRLEVVFMTTLACDNSHSLEQYGRGHRVR
jgi:hypothetical protein